VPDQTPHSSFTDRFQVQGRTFVVDNSVIGENGGRGDAPLIELMPDGTLRPALTAKGQLGGTLFRIR